MKLVLAKQSFAITKTSRASSTKTRIETLKEQKKGLALFSIKSKFHENKD